MKKDKLLGIIAFLVLLFVVFVLGLFVGRKLSPEKSKEGIIKESSLKKETAKPSISSLNTAGSQKIKKKAPVSASNIKFAPISKLVSLKNGNAAKKLAGEPVLTPPKPKTGLKTKTVNVQKRVFAKQKIPASPFVSKVYYAVQVAALSKYSDAKKLAGKLSSMGFFAYIVPISISGKNGKATYEQVRVGKFSTDKGARSVENIISKKFGLKPYIIKVD
ncbi:MAG: SPOR domain-containing protein [Deltaproteobacteria bacterium]|nr:SPOR domain-containing protein [Deltaproteobacteria bacterium]